MSDAVKVHVYEADTGQLLDAHTLEDGYLVIKTVKGDHQSLEVVQVPASTPTREHAPRIVAEPFAFGDGPGDVGTRLDSADWSAVYVAQTGEVELDQSWSRRDGRKVVAWMRAMADTIESLLPGEPGRATVACGLTDAHEPHVWLGPRGAARPRPFTCPGIDHDVPRAGDKKEWIG